MREDDEGGIVTESNIDPKDLDRTNEKIRKQMKAERIMLSGRPEPHVKVSDQGALLVKDLENWIAGLTPLSDSGGGMVLMKDSDTGVEFYIKRAT